MAKEDYEVLSEEIVEYFKKIEKSFALPMDVKFTFLSNVKQKKLIKIQKLSDIYSYLLDADVLVIFNEDYFNSFDDQTRIILLEQEIDKIEFDMQKGTISIKEPEINTSYGIIEKYTLKLVENANKLQKEFESQRKEKQKEESEAKQTIKKKRRY